ncbi:hypothetical protein E5676_scaffold124G00170 [Cucumis melo var. makuwa]|uniref:Uncharacterized protein n=1 Tax=Cucumis melo var. makuwa TaxID=1194695 RepID=A0A5A7TJK9_CUCMM|nr:hypothetical protein E6C27_scaffold67G006490 [Cucumis melo var. makuwa]TYK26731.1 hypothetical protein E5676_scaffold124G00170 [Cucumis melo var. makuwa]
MHERENLPHDFFLLAMGSSSEVCSYSGCIIVRPEVDPTWLKDLLDGAQPTPTPRRSQHS